MNGSLLLRLALCFCMLPPLGESGLAQVRVGISDRIPIGKLETMDDELLIADREWFKSKVGWDVNEIPREISFGARTITQPDVLIVSDILKDLRFAKNQQIGR